MGAPSKLTDENRLKIKQAAAYDATREEMAYLCNVSFQTIYNWFKEEPELLEEVERLRKKPVLQARKTIVEALKHDTKLALTYAERKLPLEFMPQSKIEHSGSIDNPSGAVNTMTTEEAKKIREEFEIKLRDQITKPRNKLVEDGDNIINLPETTHDNEQNIICG